MTFIGTLPSDLGVRRSTAKTLVITIALDLAIVSALGPFLLLFGGCSAIGVRDPRNVQHPARTSTVVCDASYVAPVIDTAFAIADAPLISRNVTHPDVEGHSVSDRDFAGSRAHCCWVGSGSGRELQAHSGMDQLRG